MLFTWVNSQHHVAGVRDDSSGCSSNYHTLKHCCGSVGCGWFPGLATAQVTSQKQWAWPPGHWAGPTSLGWQRAKTEVGSDGV